MLRLTYFLKTRKRTVLYSSLIHRYIQQQWSETALMGPTHLKGAINKGGSEGGSNRFGVQVADQLAHFVSRKTCCIAGAPRNILAYFRRRISQHFDGLAHPIRRAQEGLRIGFDTASVGGIASTMHTRWPGSPSARGIAEACAGCCVRHTVNRKVLP